MGWEKLIDIASWLKDKLPIPNRLEAIKNEILKLEQERSAILIGKADVKKSKRLEWINNRLVLLNKRLQNATPTS